MVYFIGAGPGDPELITIKGQKLLQTADVIIYAGSLVNPALLTNAKSDCKIWDSAKLTLEQVMEIIVEHHKENKNIVRLHTGDPSMYGAIKEQMSHLDNKNIPYTIIPGVSSVFGAAAALKAEYTVPGISQTLILTRMADRTPVPENEDIEKLAKIQASMAIFLSAGLLEPLSKKLINGGYKEETPAAIVYKATWEDEKIVRTTVKDLANAAKIEGIKKTALIVVGDFLGNEFQRSLLYHPKFTHEFRTGEN